MKMTVNYSKFANGEAGVNFSLRSLGVPAVRGQEGSVNRVLDKTLDFEKFGLLKDKVSFIGVTPRFENVIKTFAVPEGETPAGFRVETYLGEEGLLLADLVRDISYDRNGVKRPTKTIFSADSANPYEIAPISALLGNLTCNPGIVYDLFINNPKANVGKKFKTLEEVMTEIGRVLGPGCDISVELNNPFEEDFSKILDECEKFKGILSEYRLVVKVPHMGPVNKDNVSELLSGDKKFSIRYDQAATEDAFRSHNLALKLREHGYRINYTLMFEPYQTALALQAKPAFINTFVRHRLMQTTQMKNLLAFFDISRDKKYLEELRAMMLNVDLLSKNETDKDLLAVKQLAEDIVKYREFDCVEGEDGLDMARHNLRLLKQNNLPDTRLIICSMEGPYNYPDIDKLVVEPEFVDVIDRLVITAEPGYLASFTANNQVVSYQRRFMNAVQGAK
jgi:hypothetical protein